MKNRKLFWLIIYLLFAVDVNGNFWKYYGSGRLNDCILTADSSIVTVGNGFLVMKTNLLGDTIWTRYFPDYTGPMSVNEAISVTETPDHYYLICGYSGNLSTITQRLVKVDAAGNLIWAKNFANGSATSIEVNHRGLYLMTLNGELGNDEIYLSELDTSGNAIWQSTVTFINNPQVWGLSLDQYDNAYICGAFSFASSEAVGYILKFDSAGNPLDTTQFFSPPYGNNLSDVIVLNDTDVYACGSFHNSWSDRIGRVVKLNHHGDTIHTRILPYRFTGQCIRHEPIQNLIVVAGFGYDSTQNYASVFVTWLDTSLNIIAVKQIDSTGDEQSFGFALNQNQIYIAGSTTYSGPNEIQWIYMLDTSIISNLSDVNKNNSVFYFSNNSLHYFLGNERRGTIVFYDITGREMKKINLLENYGNVNIQNFPAGLYVSVLINSKKEIINAIKILL